MWLQTLEIKLETKHCSLLTSSETVAIFTVNILKLTFTLRSSKYYDTNDTYIIL